MTPSDEDIRPEGQPGVLASLPSTRPQRPSARRAAARRKTAAVAEATTQSARGKRPAGDPAARERARARRPAKAKAKPTSEAKSSRSKQTTTAGRTGSARAAGARSGAAAPQARPAFRDPPIPRQGFETEDQIAPGSTVRPPTGAELATGVLELLEELTQGGLAAGERFLKDVLGRLPRT